MALVRAISGEGLFHRAEVFCEKCSKVTPHDVKIIGVGEKVHVLAVCMRQHTDGWKNYRTCFNQTILKLTEGQWKALIGL